MYRRLHIVAVSEDLSWTLALQTTGGWLLPWIDVDGHETLFPRLEARLASLVTLRELIHAAPIPPQHNDDVRQGYCVALVSDPRAAVDVAAVSHQTLVSTRALLPRQRAAWNTAMDRLRVPSASFDGREQTTAARQWAEHELMARLGVHVVSVVPHRCLRDDYVVRYQTANGAAYFKGGPERARDEGELTRRLWAVSPQHFPETISLDTVGCRWLYRELPGRPLSTRQLTIEMAVAAIRTLAMLQRRVLDAPDICRHLESRRVTASELFARVDAIVGQTWLFEAVAPAQEDGLRRSWDEHCDRMRATCAAIDALDLPQTLVISDLWPGNVLATPHGIGFVDLGQSYWSYPVLSLSRFIKNVEAALHSRGRARTAIEHAFVDSWAEVVDPARMRKALPHLSLLNRLLGTVLKNSQVARWQQDLLEELPGWYRAIELRRFVQSCIDASVVRGTS